MSAQLFLKPKGEDARIRMPEHGNDLMPAYGQAVPNNQYYLRRIRDGVVTKTSGEDIEKGRTAALKKIQEAAKKVADEEKNKNGDK